MCVYVFQRPGTPAKTSHSAVQITPTGPSRQVLALCCPLLAGLSHASLQGFSWQSSHPRGLQTAKRAYAPLHSPRQGGAS